MKSVSLLFAMFLLLLAPFFGLYNIQLTNLLDITSIDYHIFWTLRVPRVILAFFAGGILSISGLIFQIVFKNPLSTPYTLGVASASTLGVAIAIIGGWGGYVFLFSFVGAIVSIVVLFVINSKIKNFNNTTLLLVGIALSFFYSSSLMIAFYVSDLRDSFEIVRFTMGSLNTVGFNDVYILGFSAIVVFVLIYNYRHKLKLLIVSDDFAHLKGLDIKKSSYYLLFISSIGIGMVVSISGPIGFVGLIIPHILKNIFARSSDLLLKESFFYGGVFLVFCDIMARNLNTDLDIPIGIITSFLGAPYFVYLIINKRG
jgi:iron complex transport system permease protein